MKIGVIGSGQISDIYLKNMMNRFGNLEVLAVASAHSEHAAAKAAAYGIRSCSVDEMLSDPQIEMIVNLTPVGAHENLIRRALMAGKHVYTEKTMTDCFETAKELVLLAEEKGLYLGSAPDTFLGASLQTARKAIDSGMAGEINSFVIAANRNNDDLLSRVPFLREPGAGIVYDYAVYYVTALVSLLGSARRVFGQVRTPYPKHINNNPQDPLFGSSMSTPNESEASAVITLQNGITGTLHLNADSFGADQAYFALFGTKGILYLTDPNQFGGNVRFLPVGKFKEKTEMITLVNNTPFSENSRGVGPAEMADAIEKKRPCRASMQMALHVEEILSAILKGGEQGGAFELTTNMERPRPLCEKDGETF